MKSQAFGPDIPNPEFMRRIAAIHGDEQPLDAYQLSIEENARRERRRREDEVVALCNSQLQKLRPDWELLRNSHWRTGANDYGQFYCRSRSTGLAIKNGQDIDLHRFARYLGL